MIRIAVAIVGIPVVLWAVINGEWLFFILISAVILLSLWEFYTLCEMKLVFPNKWAGLIAAWIVSFLIFTGSITATIFSVFLAIFVFIMVLEIWRNRPNSILNIAVTLAGIIYIGMFFSSTLLFRAIYGWKLLLYLLLVVWVCDTFSYFFGTIFGRHKLFPRVSPNKSYEGALAGLMGAMLVAYLSHRTFLHSYAFQDIYVLAFIGGGLGQVGDLLESLLKRDASVKDSSHILPGHGGILDRFDSLLITFPLAYVYMQLFFKE
jgi:phosphatidate cytidylyltransferase